MSTNYEILRRDELFFDFTILVEDREFKVHKVVMASESDYLKAMLRSDMVESKRNEVRLQDIDASTMEIVIDFCYTKKIQVTNDNIADLLSAASMMQMQGLKDACSLFLAQHMDSKNCLQILSQAVREKLDDFIEQAVSFCCANFKSVVGSEDFLLIDHESLGLIIKDDRLDVKDESEVLAAVTRWVESDLATRKSHLDDLGPYVRFALFEPAKLVEATESGLVANSTVCSNLCDVAKNLHLLKLHPQLKAISEEKLNTKHRSGSRKTYLHVFGYHEEYETMECSSAHSRYCFETKEWIHGLPTPTYGGVGFAFAGLGRAESVYVYGFGFFRFDLRTGERNRDLAAPAKGRQGCRALQVDDTGIAILGLVDGNALGLEFYSIALDRWWSAERIRGFGRSDFAAIFHNDKIFVAGGRNISGGSFSADVWVYNGSWSYHSEMQIPRASFSLCECGGRIYAVGGDKGRQTAEFFDEEENTWRTTSYMYHDYVDHIRAICYDNIIYALSFHQGNWEEFKDGMLPFGVELEINDVRLQSYDPRTRIWTGISDFKTTPDTNQKHFEILLAAC